MKNNIIMVFVRLLLLISVFTVLYNNSYYSTRTEFPAEDGYYLCIVIFIRITSKLFIYFYYYYYSLIYTCIT